METINMLFGKSELKALFLRRSLSVREGDLIFSGLETLAQIWDEIISTSVKEAIFVVFPEIAATLLLKKIREGLKITKKDFEEIVTSIELSGLICGLGKGSSEDMLKLWLGNPRKEIEEIYKKIPDKKIVKK